MGFTKAQLYHLLYLFTDIVAYVFTWTLGLFFHAYFQGEAMVSPNLLDLVVVVIMAVGVHNLLGIYKHLWSYGGMGSAVRLALAALITQGLIYELTAASLGVRVHLVLVLLATYVSLSLSLLIRLYRQLYHAGMLYVRTHWPLSKFTREHWAQSKHYRTLLVGAGDGAYAFIRQEQANPHSRRELVCMVDNDLNKQGYSMHGVPIVSTEDRIAYIIKKYQINEVILATPNLSPKQTRRIMAQIPMDCCVTRRITGLLHQTTQQSVVAEIEIRDVLGRKENLPNTALMNDWVQGKTVMITGGAGSIGSEICNQLLTYSIAHLVIFDISEYNVFNLMTKLSLVHGPDIHEKITFRIGSVQDEIRLCAVFEAFKPEIVFHAAAYKHVPFMEESPRLAYNNNTLGTLITARHAQAHGVNRFVLVSTDKAVNPANVMGASKRLAELAVLGLNMQSTTEFVCVRFGNVLDSNGSVVPTFKAQIAAGGPVTLTHPEITRYFMTIPEAAGLVLEAGALAKGGEIFILDMGEPVKIKDLAENLILLSGLTPGADIKIEVTGLRPGEKLYEELLLEAEGLTKTPNEKIFVAQPAYPLDLHLLIEMLLASLQDNTDELKVYEAIRRFVPEYTGTFPRE